LGARRTCGDQGGAVTGEAGDVVDAGGVDGFGEGHRRQDEDDATGQPRLTDVQGTQDQEVMSEYLLLVALDVSVGIHVQGTIPVELDH
jgi:hypothetical protein